MIMPFNEPRFSIFGDLGNFVDLLRPNRNVVAGLIDIESYVFRDGVSENQFEAVEEKELQQFRDACKAVDPKNGDDVKFTLIIVQKRQHTRFFAEHQSYGNIIYKNMEPGNTL